MTTALVRTGATQVASRPAIALLIPVWNRQNKLDRALNSLLSEADLLKVVVIDDGSTPAIRIQRKTPLDIELIRLEHNQGIARALNAGLTYAFACNFSYIGRLDSDDIALPGRFRKQLLFMDDHPEIGICGSGYIEYNVQTKQAVTILAPLHDRAIRRGMHLRTTLWHPTVLIRSEIAREIGYYDPRQPCEDVDYFLKVMAISQAANLPEALIRYESGAEEALTGTAARRRKLAAALIRLKLQHSEFMNPLWWLGIIAGMLYFLNINHFLKRGRNRLVVLLGS